MTQNRRIVLNVIATYGRSLYSLLCGLFTCRWLLMALGKEDYGLYGVVGGLSGFVLFISYILQGATSRFYAFNIGKATAHTSTEAECLEECRKWFNTSLAIHIIVPLLLVLILYVVGDWAVREFLEIPLARVNACRWVLRFTCLSCFAGMFNVPFYGMYIAKQYIAELTIYTFVTTTLNLGFVYYITVNQGDWLAVYAAWMCALSVITQCIICARAIHIFPECKIRFKYWFNVKRFKEMANYAGWNLIGGTATTLQGQGSAVLVNKYFGPLANAGFTVANSVNQHCTTLASAMRSALIPAITTICGSGDYQKMRKMSMQACKFSTLLSLVFMLPLALELPKVIELWLKSPPPYVVGLCWCLMFCSILEYMGLGQAIAISAFGRVAKYDMTTGISRSFMIPVAWGLISFGFSIYSVGVSYIIVMLIFVLIRAWFSRSLASLSIWQWVKEVVCPIFLVTLLSLVVGLSTRLVLEESILRVLFTSLVVEITLLPLSWFLVLTLDERHVLASKITNIVSRIRRT